MDSAISLVQVTPPSGMPLPMPLAIVIMSGFTPQCSMPHHLSPVRPKPVCTSSEMNNPPYFFTMSYTISKYSFGGSTTPPNPWIGSPMNAAILPDVLYLMTSSSSRAQATLHDGYVKPNGQR